MNRNNIYGGPKSWKSNNDGHKPTNSVILNEQYKCTNNNNVPNYSSKNSKEMALSKVHTIQRHCSEDDFKRYFAQGHSPSSDYHQRVDEDYFPDNISTNLKHKKNSLFLSKIEKPQLKGVIKEKPYFQNIQIKQNALKQTSSTQSQENLKAFSRPIPSFMRNRQNDYKYMRLSSPRMNLRRENFKIISKLGEGKFGKVFMVKESNTGFILAMKIVEKNKIIRQNLLDQFIRELKIQSFLNHPNIISLYGFFQDQTHFYTLMQLGCDSQLYSLIEHNKILAEETTSFIIKNLLQAISYMHSNKILHRDIKPENIVLIMGNVKLCDFGWAVNKLHPGDLRNTFCGTPLYLSPQILQGNGYDEKVDLWAIGILAFELLLGESPFQIMDQCDLKKIITEDVKFSNKHEISDQFKEFIHAMLAKDPSTRLNSQKLLQLDFIRKYEGLQTCEELCK